MAYEKIITEQPNSSLLLAMAVMCYHQNHKKYKDLLRIVPYVREWEGVLYGEFIISIVEYEKYSTEISKICRHFSDKKLSKFTIPGLGKAFRIIAPDSETGAPSVLNLSAYKFQMSLESMLDHMNGAVLDMRQ